MDMSISNSSQSLDDVRSKACQLHLHCQQVHLQHAIARQSTVARKGCVVDLTNSCWTMTFHHVFIFWADKVIEIYDLTV